MLSKSAGPARSSPDPTSPPRMNGVRHSPNAQVSLTPDYRSCNSKSRQPRKWNSVKPGNCGAPRRKKQSSTNPADSIQAGVLRRDCHSADPNAGILKMYWHSCNTSPGRLANSSYNGENCAAITQQQALHKSNVARAGGALSRGPTAPGAFRRGRTGCGSIRRKCRPCAAVRRTNPSRRSCRRAARGCSRSAAPSTAGGR
jgi:hypothetical protein